MRDYLARSLHAYARVTYARDTGDRDVGEGAGSPAQIRQRVEAITKAARSLQAALVPADDAATSTVAIMLMAGDVDVGLLNNHVDATIAALEKVEISKGGGRPLDDSEHWLLMDRIADLFELDVAQRQARLKDSTLGLLCWARLLRRLFPNG